MLLPPPDGYRQRPTRGWLRLARDAWRAEREGRTGIVARQQVRLRAMIAHARAHSPFYRDRWAGLPDSPRLEELLPVSKPELMARFDEWASDPRVRRGEVERFVADPARAGSLLGGEFAVWTTSGTTGEPGMFVHDRVALGVYDALTVTRAHGLAAADLPRVLMRGLRIAAVVATGGHHVSTSMVNLNRRRFPALARRIRIFSVLTPLPHLVEGLNGFDPAILVGYPTALELLAQEAERGRLNIRPALAIVGGEVLAPEARRIVKRAFDARILDQYAASEFYGIAFSCRWGRLHANTDWVVLEPVERDLTPTPPDRASHTVLITNLANRVQPIVRYDLGDSLTVSSRCECDSPFPVIVVAGRRGDALRLPGADGNPIVVLPLALGAVIEKTPGVRRFQAYQTGDSSIAIRLEASDEDDDDATWRRAAERVDAFLRGQGAENVRLVRDGASPARDPRTQKYRAVWDAREPTAVSSGHVPDERAPVRVPRGGM